MPDRFERLLPYSGVLAGLLFVVTMFSTYAEEYGDPDAARIINDHAGSNTAAYLAMTTSCVALLFFAGAIRAAFRRSDHGAPYAAVACGAAVLVAASKAFDAMLLKAGLDAAERDDLEALHTLAYLGSASWLPWVAASAALYLAFGLGGLHTEVLPRWVAVLTVVMGVACLLGAVGLGPAGIGAYLLTPLWLVVTGVVLARRATPAERRRAGSGSSPTGIEDARSGRDPRASG